MKIRLSHTSAAALFGVAIAGWTGAWGAPTARVQVANGYYKLEVSGSRVRTLRVDPAGKGAYSGTRFLELGMNGVREGPAVKLVRVANSVRTSGLILEQPVTLELPKGGPPTMLESGHRLGQSFRVSAGRMYRVVIPVPTWHSADSAATLVLRRDGPDGAVVAQRRMAKVPDNSDQALEFPPQASGVYYLEMRDPKGSIGWWGSKKRARKNAQAYMDGHPVSGIERALTVFGKVTVGDARAEYRLDGSDLIFDTRIQPRAGQQVGSGAFLAAFRWDNTGYDAGAKAVPFFRFFTDTMRYMPVQQLKRWKERNGWYELNFAGCRWIEADGTGNHDFRFAGRRLGLRWHLGDERTTLHFTVNPLQENGAVVMRLRMTLKPRDDALPSGWPRFVLPDVRSSHDANVFFYERAFTYPPVWGPMPWGTWITLTRCWQGGAHLDAIRNYLETYPMAADGYVDTWGNNPGWPFPDNSRYDTRHFDTNARFILACRQYAAWSGDKAFLERQAARLRKAMAYQLEVLQGKKTGLIVAASKDVTGRHKGVGDNYWDILPFGHLDAFANAVWYASLGAMADIEQALSSREGSRKASGKHAPEFYRALAVRAREAYNRTFWDNAKGRYIGCLDVDGQKHDYGFTFVNIEAMAYGLADSTQAARIYQWMEKGVTSAGKADTYSAWIFAPRANTLHNPRWNPKKGKLELVPQAPWWHFGWHGTAYGDQCQDGGAILYTSFFDLMARTRLVGPDNAWARWQAILDRWRMPDHLCGGPPLFRGEHPQQINAGAVGLDIPFPESGMVPCWLLYGVLGVNPTLHGIEVRPRLPSSLPWVEVRNVAYHGLLLDFRADRHEVCVSCATPPECRFTWRQSYETSGSVLFERPPAPAAFPDAPVWQHPGQWRAQWIWLADAEAPIAFFRKTFMLQDTKGVRAWIAATADNEFTLALNGTRIAHGTDWQSLVTVDMTKNLRKGRNVLTAEVHNAGGPGGFILQGELRPAKGRARHIVSDAHWSVSSKTAGNWEAATFDNHLWKSATERGKPPCGPWGDIGRPEPPSTR